MMIDGLIKTTLIQRWATFHMLRKKLYKEYTILMQDIDPLIRDHNGIPYARQLSTT